MLPPVVEELVRDAISRSDTASISHRHAITHHRSFHPFTEVHELRALSDQVPGRR